MSSGKSFTLNDGNKIPAVGLGTWQAKPNEVKVAVEAALRSGYRHIDCAAIYRNENEVGEGIAASGISRSDIFLTSKLWNTKHDPKDVEAALDKTLKDLRTDYIDLYLMHWPTAFKSGDKWFPLSDDGVFQLSDVSYIETYKAMEALVKTGKVKSIGVSNFNLRKLKDLLSATTITPAVNQIEAHPWLQQPELFDFCKSKQILIEAYSPLGNNQTGEPRCIDDEAIISLAKEQGKDAAQLLVSWSIQRGVVCLPKSVSEGRIKSNFQDFQIPQDTFDKLNSMDKHKRFNFPKNWGDNIFEESSDEEISTIANSETTKKSNLTKFAGI